MFAVILPFIFPGVLPSRDEYLRLDRWAPLIERPAYRFCARALEVLDSWRASALAEAVEDMSGKETVLEKYYALIHTVAHLTLLCSGSGATPWLSDMAKSFTWTNWTPTFPLVRERTVWLAAAGLVAVADAVLHHEAMAANDQNGRQWLIDFLGSIQVRRDVQAGP